MVEASEKPQKRRYPRRSILKAGGALAASFGVGALFGRQTVDNSQKATRTRLLTPEQLQKQEALRELAKFMTENTNSKLVANFLADASPEQINKAFTIGVVTTDYGAQFTAWQLRLPQASTDPDQFAPTVSFITSELNPSFASPGQDLWAYLDRKGEIRVGIKKDDPNLFLGGSDKPGYDPFTEEEMKSAFLEFASDPAFLGEEGWDVHYKNQQTGKVTEFLKTVEAYEKRKAVRIQETGFAMFSITDITQPKSPSIPVSV